MLRGRTAGRDYKTSILSLMFFKRLSDQWDNEPEERAAQLEKERGTPFKPARREKLLSDASVHRFTIPDGCHWNLPAPDGSGARLIPNEVVVELLNRFNRVPLSNTKEQRHAVAELRSRGAAVRPRRRQLPVLRFDVAAGAGGAGSDKAAKAEKNLKEYKDPFGRFVHNRRRATATSRTSSTSSRR